jgi:hypothetical protein
MLGLTRYRYCVRMVYLRGRLLRIKTGASVLHDHHTADEVHRMCTGYAVQVLSRFVIPHHLLTTNSFTPNGLIISVCNTGQNYKNLDVEDLSLKKVKAAGRSDGLFTFDQSKRDSTVLDAFIEVSHPHSRQNNKTADISHRNST